MPEAPAEPYKTEVTSFGVEQIPVVFRKAPSPEDLPQIYQPLNPRVEQIDGITVERDVAVTLRDGTTMYTDVLRPTGATDVPAIIAWSAPGKNYTFSSKGMNKIVPEGAVSPLTKQEGPDPEYWCHFGYAVINPDPRGSANSEGDINFLGTADALDCYDLVEWVASQPWSNRRVGMHGTAFSGVCSWFTAAQRPPHLVAIAPWEAFYDLYRDVLAPGGIPDTQMFGHILSRLHGHQGVEDVLAMAETYPLVNGYWTDKRARVEDIDIPVYVTANVNMFHQAGADAFNHLATDRKWLRIHDSISWRDLYTWESLEDLRRFFDRYLKEIHNGWEFTPSVRVSVYDANGDIVNRPETTWPPARTTHRPLYLQADRTLTEEPAGEESTVSYVADGTGSITFTYTFTDDTETTGYGKLRLWVEAEGADDLDLHVALAHLDAAGKPVGVPWFGQPHGGTSGALRVSLRELDAGLSTEDQPFLTFAHEQRLSAGEIVSVDIPLYAFGFDWHAGDQLQVTIADHLQRSGAGSALMTGGKAAETRNAGRHVVHFAGRYDSHLLLPITPRH